MSGYYGGGGEVPDGLGETIFSRTVDDELIDWSNKVDIPIPSWATKVELTIEPKSGQSGAGTYMGMRFNSDAGANYWSHVFGASGAVPLASIDAALDNLTCFYCSQSGLEDGRMASQIFTKNHGKYMEQIFDWAFTDASDDKIRNNRQQWRNVDDDISSVQIYSVNSTKVSCVITVRAWE